MGEVLGVIPARWASSRFPGKALHPIAGRPLLARVLDRVRCARRLNGILVATDDERIARLAMECGVEAVMTSPSHPSGTDRIAEAVRDRAADVVVNIQGDEPLVDPQLVDAVAGAIGAHEGWEMATAAAPIEDLADLTNPSVVKVVFAEDSRALYFSRAPIPYDRDGVAAAEPAPVWWRHIGLYAYRRDFLERLVAEPPCQLERLERLEQLRALHLGARIRVVRAAAAGVGVDTPEDVARAEAALRAMGGA
ncbi:MAG: 3-deoxy-manno-octulosonate cytidylyltransferase [Kiritimatiellae bacterium]|nr:3-deoxy-manno-octulosonate cytidylyltransferase [Kiritimatiellia bacterium]